MFFSHSVPRAAAPWPVRRSRLVFWARLGSLLLLAYCNLLCEFYFYCHGRHNAKASVLGWFRRSAAGMTMAASDGVLVAPTGFRRVVKAVGLSPKVGGFLLTGFASTRSRQSTVVCQHLSVMGCFSTEGIRCATDLGHLAHPPPSTDIFRGCTGHGALIAPVFGTIPRNPFCASYGMGSCFQRRFLGTTTWCYAPGLEVCLLYSFYW